MRPETPKPLDDAALGIATGGAGPLDPPLHTGEDMPGVTPIDPEGGPSLVGDGDGSGADTLDGSGLLPWG